MLCGGDGDPVWPWESFLLQLMWLNWSGAYICVWGYTWYVRAEGQAVFTPLPPMQACSFPRRSRRVNLLDCASENTVYVTPWDMDLTPYPSWTDLSPMDHGGCQQQVVTVKDEHILAWDNAKRGKTPNVWSILSVKGLWSGNREATQYSAFLNTGQLPVTFMVCTQVPLSARV